jgi:hypothetical protein
MSTAMNVRRARSALNIDQDLATGVGGDWINDHQYRDTIGLINWEAITANTWRWAK